jgi:hypothetical protein
MLLAGVLLIAAVGVFRTAARAEADDLQARDRQVPWIIGLIIASKKASRQPRSSRVSRLPLRIPLIPAIRPMPAYSTVAANPMSAPPTAAESGVNAVIMRGYRFERGRQSG